MDRLHGDLSQRVAVASDELPWTPRDGYEERVLEHADDRRTALLRLPPGVAVPIGGAAPRNRVAFD